MEKLDKNLIEELKTILRELKSLTNHTEKIISLYQPLVDKPIKK